MVKAAIPPIPQTDPERRREDRDCWLRSSKAEKIKMFAEALQHGNAEFLHNVRDRLDPAQTELYNGKYRQPVLSEEQWRALKSICDITAAPKPQPG